MFFSAHQPRRPAACVTDPAGTFHPTSAGISSASPRATAQLARRRHAHNHRRVVSMTARAGACRPTSAQVWVAARKAPEPHAKPRIALSRRRLAASPMDRARTWRPQRAWIRVGRHRVRTPHARPPLARNQRPAVSTTDTVRIYLRHSAQMVAVWRKESAQHVPAQAAPNRRPPVASPI
jgi:hypothetical protein